MPKLNQQNLIISRVAVSFNSSLYLCAFYAPYSELLQSLKSIKLAPSISISISYSFFLSHSTTKKQRQRWEQDNVDSFRWKSGKRWYSRLWLYRTPRGHAMLTAMGAWTGTRHCVRGRSYQSRDFYVDCLFDYQLRITIISMELFAENCLCLLLTCAEEVPN